MVSIPIARSRFKGLCRRLFSVFSNNSILDPNILENADLLEWNLSRVPRRHRSQSMSHVLADYGRVDPGEFPSAVAASSKSIRGRRAAPLF
jgi:hypothetical protein